MHHVPSRLLAAIQQEMPRDSICFPGLLSPASLQSAMADQYLLPPKTWVDSHVQPKLQKRKFKMTFDG